MWLQQSRLMKLALISCVALLATAPARGVADEAMSAAAFSQLSEPKQIAYLRDRRQEFQRQTGNISASVTVSVKNVEYDAETRAASDKVTMQGSTKDYELRRIGPSYRVSVRALPPVQKPRVYYPLSIESYDADSGVMRQLDVLMGKDLPKRYSAVISPDRGTVAASCKFFQYLGDEDSHGQIALADLGHRFLKSHEDARVEKVDADAETMDVAFDTTLPWGTKGRCIQTFDLGKAGLLTRMQLTEVDDSEANPIERHRYDMTLGDPIVVDGVWVPTRFGMTAWSAAHPKQMTVHTATIEDIQLNKLTKHDLEVEFPAEAQVSDRRFQVGPDGQRIPNSEGAKVLARLRQPLEKMVGQPAPELPKDGWVGGERPDLTGQPYLLHFWATWCGPCKRDLPVVKWLAEEGAHIVGVHPGGTPADEVARFVDQLELNYSTFVDSSDGDERPRILAGFPSGVFPYCVLVDAQGNVAAHGFLREVVGEFRSLRDAK